jgi:hypothetical protein
MKMKELTVLDFPLKATDEVILAFKGNRKVKQVAEIMMGAIYTELAAMECLDPWDKVKESMPEVGEFAKAHTLNYSAINGTFTIKPE